jgi:hypothetical protein
MASDDLRWPQMASDGHQMASDGFRCSHMTSDGLRWLQMAQGWTRMAKGWIQMASDGLGWPRVASDGLRWTRMAWPQMASDGFRWPQMALAPRRTTLQVARKTGGSAARSFHAYGRSGCHEILHHQWITTATGDTGPCKFCVTSGWFVSLTCGIVSAAYARMDGSAQNHSALASDGLGWPRMASDGLGWPRMASGGLGWRRMAPDGLR